MTSESVPAHENHSENHTDREANDQHNEPAPQVSLASAHSQSTPSPHHCDITCKTKRDWIDRATLGLEGIGLAVLVAYTIFTGLMYCANKQAADAATSAANTAAQSMHLDQRPWIGVVVGQGALVSQRPIRMPIRIINTGKTPAIKVHGSIVVNLLREDEEPDFAYAPGHPKYDVEGHTILPNLPQDLAFAALPKYVAADKPLNQILVTDTVRQGMKEGKLYTVVHGEIIYDDIFGVSRWIRFCNYGHNVVGLRLQSVANTCGQYNDVDKNK